MIQSSYPLSLVCVCVLKTVMSCQSGSRCHVWYTLYNCCCLSIKALLQAQPVKVGHAVAIQPSNAPLTVPDAPRLTLNDRSASRQAFDAAVAQKQKQAEVSLHA